MPLDTSTYALAHLRTDGRRWNELRRISGQMSTQPSADGSSTFEMGNTKVLCTVHGPREPLRGSRGDNHEAKLDVEIGLAGFSGTDRKKRSRNDKRMAEMQYTLAAAFGHAVFVAQFPHSVITVRLHVLAQDGALLAACVNAMTLALVDAGVPMREYVAACTAGSTGSYASNEEEADPLLDLNGGEEVELPFLTVGTVGEKDEVSLLVMETKVQRGRLEGMLSVGLDGCKQIRKMLDAVVRSHGKRLLEARVG